MPPMPRPTMTAGMVSMPSKVQMASRPAICLTTRWSSRMPLPPSMASARLHRFADIRDTRNRRANSRSLAPASIRSEGTIRSAAASRIRVLRRSARRHRGVSHGSGIARCAGHHQS